MRTMDSADPRAA